MANFSVGEAIRVISRAVTAFWGVLHGRYFYDIVLYARIMEEKRKFPRYERSLEVRYSNPKNASQGIYTISKNVSKHGINIAAAGPLKSGDAITLDIDLKNSKPAISVLGKIAWIKPRPRPAPLDLDAGIEFTKVDESAMERLIGA